MFLLNSLHFGSLRRRFSTMFVRSVFAQLTLACLFAAIFFTGCSTDEDDPASLHGTWRDSFDNKFIIETIAGTLEYVDAFEVTSYKGTIKEIVKLNSAGTAGIIFLKFHEDSRPQDWGTAPDFVPIPVEGDYIGVFFVNLTSASAQFANPYDLVQGRTPAQNNLEDAKERFTQDTIGDYFAITAAFTRIQ